MLPAEFVPIDLFAAGWEPWAAGALAVVLVLIVARFLFSRNRGTGREPTPAESSSQEEAPVLDPFTHGSPEDKRQAARRRGYPVPVHISDAEAKAVPYHGFVADRSLRGLALNVDEAVPVGTVLSVRPAKEAEQIPWVQVAVKNCVKGEDGWQLGCEFIRTPPSSVLMLFG